MILQAPTERIKRSQIDFAAYNPRRISEGNKKRLKKSLKEYGLVQDPIWNKRTGGLSEVTSASRSWIPRRGAKTSRST
jgi:hypothetical protein